MRFYELNSNIRVPASIEESDLIEKLKEQQIFNEELNYREQELARKLVSRGLIERVFIENKMTFKLK